jgi:class 3 adenylate cyclase
MAGERVVRRLAAILAADVVGYSRLMGRDENGTLTRLKAHRTQRLEPTLARHGGRLVKLTGDGALIEFPSAVNALSAAIEFQQAMTESNREQPGAPASPSAFAAGYGGQEATQGLRHSVTIPRAKRWRTACG